MAPTIARSTPVRHLPCFDAPGEPCPKESVARMINGTETERGIQCRQSRTLCHHAVAVAVAAEGCLAIFRFAEETLSV